MNYNLICRNCLEHNGDLQSTLYAVQEQQFEDLDRNALERFIGQPEIFERSSTLFFAHRHVTLEFPSQASLLSVVPRLEAASSQWFVLLATGELVLMDFSQHTTSTLYSLAASEFRLTDESALHVSFNGQFATVVNNRENAGVVIDLTTGSITMRLDRNSHHPRTTRFPVTFFEYEGRSLLVHGTDWNRLDISDPKTGELLTKRPSPQHENGKAQAHYLDYFHALPVISPEGVWIAEDGWVWQPWGIVRAWNLHRWLTQNVWESEDGTSLRSLAGRGYWDYPLCWLDNQRLALWGFGDDDAEPWFIPAIQVFDVETGKRVQLFAGPKAQTLYFDTYLFAVSTAGIEVWDVETGERLHHDGGLVPISFHPHTHEFLSAVGNGEFALSRLIDSQS